jgi:cytoskeletal protein CcmA (bactofilin family)
LEEDRMASKNGTTVNSVVGEGSIFEGKFYIHGSLQIDGKFEGEVKTEDQLVIGETGRVKTDIFARSVIVGGTVIGNIHADEQVSLLATGRVLGNINSPRVAIEEGVVVRGEISISAGHQKEIQKVVEESFDAGPKIDDVLREKKKVKTEAREKIEDAGT